MNLITFNPFKTIGMPNISYIKPINMLTEELKIKTANYLLFPEYWQVNSLVYGWHKEIFPSINSYHLGHDKIEMTRLFQALLPENTPYTLITGRDDNSLDRILDSFAFPFVAKEVRSSEGKGVSLIENRTDLKNYLANNSILYCQEYLPIDRDLRVVLIGDRVFSAYWRIGQAGDFRNNLAQGGEISSQGIPDQALALVEDLAKKTGINHAGFDLAVVGSHYYLLEFNVFFGNQGLAGRSKEINNYIYQYLLKGHNPEDTDRSPERKKAI